VVFVVGAAATAVLGGITAWSALDTSKKHDDFASSGCAARGSDACDTAASSGTGAQTRTNVLLGATVFVGAATLLIGAAFTRWRDPPPRAAHAGGWYVEF
jgi:hypothetical protein